jgi:hypothetical protein
MPQIPVIKAPLEVAHYRVLVSDPVPHGLTVCYTFSAHSFGRAILNPC